MKEIAKIKFILLVGQTPPPYGGAAMMIKRTLEGNYGSKIKLFHIRLEFSKEMDEIGKFKIYKIFHLFNIIMKILVYRFKYNINILYYIPAGPNIVPIIRDIFILGFTRFLFIKTLFHFRASGISDYIKKKPPIIRILLKFIYNKPYAAIRLSEFTPDDSSYFNAQKKFIVYNGIEDNSINFMKKRREKDKIIYLLFLGIVKASKGINILLNACNLLAKDNVNFQCDIVGKFESISYRQYCYETIKEYNLDQKVIFHGVKIGKEKFQYIINCDIFVFPTYFESEGTPGSIIEAMSFGKPIITTYWRGVPSLVENDYNGFLTQIRNPFEVYTSIIKLINNNDKMIKFGLNSRKKYLSKFRIDIYHKEMKEVFNIL